MAGVRIGKRVVDALPAGATAWDSDVRGFGARRQRDGVSYVLKARTRAGRQLWLTIGRHGSPWTPETAREQARRLLAAIRDGRDPAQERDTNRNAPTVAAICDRFLADVERRRKPSTGDSWSATYAPRSAGLPSVS